MILTVTFDEHLALFLLDDSDDLSSVSQTSNEIFWRFRLVEITMLFCESVELVGDA